VSHASASWVAYDSMVSTRANRLFVKLRQYAFGEQFDLYALAAAAFIFTIMGVTGVADVGTLSSVTLAFLAVLATSQVRSRRMISDLASKYPEGKQILFANPCPEMISARSHASSILYVGTSMGKTLSQGRDDFRRILRSGGIVRIMLLDYRRLDLVEAVRRHYPGDVATARVAESIRHSLCELGFLRAEVEGSLEVRVADFIPRNGLRLFDYGSISGEIYIQHYEYRPAKDSPLVFRLQADDGHWYEYFAAEAERMWAGGSTVRYSDDGSSFEIGAPPNT
jgi:hypothetical protein